MAKTKYGYGMHMSLPLELGEKLESYVKAYSKNTGFDLTVTALVRKILRDFFKKVEV